MEIAQKMARVERVDLERRTVKVVGEEGGGKETLAYDRLVLAVGKVPVAAPVAAPMGSVVVSFGSAESARALRDAAAMLRARAGTKRKVVVVGTNFVGVEVSLAVRELVGRSVDVTIVGPSEVLAVAKEDFNKESARMALRDARVATVVGFRVENIIPLPTRGPEGGARLLCIDKKGKSQVIDCDLVVWAAGLRPNPLTASLGDVMRPVRGDGRLLTDSSLFIRRESTGVADPAVLALGDCAAITDSSSGAIDLPTAQAALQQSEYAAWNLRASLLREFAPNAPEVTRKPLAYRYQDLGEIVYLGPDNASVSTLGGAVQLRGPAAAVMRRGIYAARMPLIEQIVDTGTGVVEDTLSRLFPGFL